MTTATRSEETRRRARAGALHGVWLLALLGIVVLVNLISGFLFARVDLTQDRRFTLSEVSRETVRDLDGPLHAYVFLSGELPAPYNRLEREVRDLLTEYRAHSGGRFAFTFIDPGLDEADAERAENLGILPVTIGEQSRHALSFREVFLGISLVYEAPEGDREDVIEQLMPGMNLEYELTRRMRALAREEGRRVIGFLIGDGSFFDRVIEQLSAQFGQDDPMGGMMGPGEIRERIAEQLAAQIFDDLHEVRFVHVDDSLDELDGLFVMGPQRTLPDAALERIDAMVQEGRGVGFFVSSWRAGADPFGGRNPELAAQFARAERNETGLEPLLERYGVRLNADTILDRELAQISVELRTVGYMGNQPLTAPLPSMDARLPLITDLNRASLLTPNLPLLAFQPANRRSPLPISSLTPTPEARTLSAEGRLELVEVARTGDTSVRRRNAPNLSLEQALQPAADEEAGGWPVIVTLEGELPAWREGVEATDRGRVLVASSGDFITNVLSGQDSLLSPSVLRSLPPQVIQSVQQYSASSVVFLRNAADWLVAEPELIRIRARGTPSFLEADALQRERRNAVQALNILGVPAMFIVLGGVVWFQRQRRRKELFEAFAAPAQTGGEQ